MGARGYIYEDPNSDPALDVCSWVVAPQGTIYTIYLILNDIVLGPDTSLQVYPNSSQMEGGGERRVKIGIHLNYVIQITAGTGRTLLSLQGEDDTRRADQKSTKNTYP